MAFIPKAVIFHARYLKNRSAGIFSSLNEIHTSFRVSKSFDFLKKSSQDSTQNLLAEFKVEKSRTDEFKRVRRDLILLESDFRESSVMTAYNKLLTIYKTNLTTPNFKKHLNAFSESDIFVSFCGSLETKLPKYSLKSLLKLSDLEYFSVPHTSSLMRKISKLLLENLETCSLSDKLIIYAKILGKPQDVGDWKKIIDVCEAYFKKGLEEDLRYEKFSDELLSIFDIEVLPKKIKLLVAEKLLDEASLMFINKKEAIQILEKLASKAHDLLPKSTLLQHFRKCLDINTSGSLLSRLFFIYFELINKDKSYYTPEDINLISETVLKKLHQGNIPTIGCKLCEIGHMNEDFLHKTIEFLLNESLNFSNNVLLMATASFFARASFHEFIPESTVTSVRKVLETKEPFKNLSESTQCSLWCLYLTYIGCDTRDLLTRIFKFVNMNHEQNSDPNILFLHHLAKQYFPGEYEPLSEEIVEELVQKEFKKFKLQDHSYSLDECFEDSSFVLRNCITSDKHYLHFVTVFQANRKPMNLSNHFRISISDIPNVDAIERPPGSKMIAFMQYPDSQPIKFLNIPAMSGYAKMYLKSFENLNCNIVLLDREFYCLTLEDKKKYLNSQINEIFENKS